MDKGENLCAYCQWRSLKQVAEARGQFLRIKESAGEEGGVNVYQVPNEIQRYALVNGTEDHDKYFKAWFPGISDHCVC